MDIQKKIQDLVALSKLEQAIDEFLNWANANDKDLSNQLILMKGQYNALKRNENLGLLSFSDGSRDRARIANSILEMSNQIGSNNQASQPTQEASVVSNSSSAITSNDTILFLASNPVDTTKLELERELAKVHSKLQDSKYKLNSVWAVTADSLQDSILQYEPRIIHFSGHGDSSDGNSKAQKGTRGIQRASESPAGIYVRNEDTGEKQLVSANALARLFKVCRKLFNLEVVLLNACHSKEQAEAIFSAGVPFVIGMNAAVYDDSAIEFATGFYRGLAKRGNVEIAFELAVAAIELNNLKGVDTPVLYKKQS